MTSAAFDTLKAVETLREAGVEEAHAKAIAITMRDAVTEGVATKADLRAAVAELKADMLKAGIGIVVAVLLANVGVTFAIVRLLGGGGQ